MVEVRSYVGLGSSKRYPLKNKRSYNALERSKANYQRS